MMFGRQGIWRFFEGMKQRKMASLMQFIGNAFENAQAATHLSDNQMDALLLLYDDMMVEAQIKGMKREAGVSVFEKVRIMMKNFPKLEELDDVAMFISYEVKSCRGEEGIVAGLAEERGVSRQQAHKKINRGKLTLYFHRVGKRTIMPTGRKAEILIKNVPDIHWIQCWEDVLRRFEQSGKVTSANVETGVALYRLNNHLDEQTPLEAGGAIAHAVPIPRREEKATNDYSVKIVEGLLDFFSSETRRELGVVVRRSDPASVVFKLFARMGRHAETRRNAAIEEKLLQLRVGDASLMEAIDKLSAQLLLQELERQALRYVAILKRKKSQPGKTTRSLV